MQENRSTRARPASPADDAEPPSSELDGGSLIALITAQWKRERSDLDLDNFLLSIYFMRLGTLVDRAFGRLCSKRYGVSGPDMRVLLALRRGGKPYVKRPTDLFRALLVTSGAITKKVDRLAAAGLVERLPDPGHGGGFLVHLTKKGLQVAEGAVEMVANESALAPAVAQFSPKELRAGSHFTLRILAAMEEAERGFSDDGEAS